MNDWFEIVVSEASPDNGTLETQFQFPTFLFSLIAIDLIFAPQIVEFVVESLGDPGYRDQSLGGGRYRRFPEKSIDVSASFPGTEFRVFKDGEFDDAYVVHVSNRSGLRLQFDLRGQLLQSMIARLRELIPA